MALANYTDLKTAIGNWSKRTTVLAPTGDRTAEMVSLFEATANATIRLRENEIEAPLTATPASSFISLPSNYQAPVFLKVTSNQRQLRYMPADQLPYYPAQAGSYRWTVKDSRIQTERDADQAYAYTLRYHKKYDIATDTTNSLLTRYPNVYLYGCLIEAAPFVRDINVVELWQARYDRAKADLDLAEAEGRGSGITTLSFDPALVPVGVFNINTGV